MHCNDLQVPRLNTEHTKKNYQYSTVKIWNTIRTNIRELPTIGRFKKKYKEFLKLIINIIVHSKAHRPGTLRRIYVSTLLIFVS